MTEEKLKTADNAMGRNIKDLNAGAEKREDPEKSGERPCWNFEMPL
jgi:hypothetical protein